MKRLAVGLLFALFAYSCSCLAAARGNDDPFRGVVEPAVKELMKEQSIPGMAVAVVGSEGVSVFNFGVAKRGENIAVDDQTLFEIGSLTKIFTASLASLAVTQGKLELDAAASRYLPGLLASAFDRITSLNLATYTAGGLPLFVPDDVSDRESFVAWYREWQPTGPIGVSRTYSNPSIGLLGMLTAAALQKDFVQAMRDEIFDPLGLRHTWYVVPRSEMQYYAMGEDRNGNPARLSRGVVANEAYGIKATARDIAGLLQANLGLVEMDASLRAAADATRRGYFQVGDMTQGLVWESYSLPVSLERLLLGNSAEMVLGSHRARAIEPSPPPGKNVWINKTGSSNGFGAYVVMIPSEQIGLVMLANKNYPNDARVRTAFQIFSELGVMDAKKQEW